MELLKGQKSLEMIADEAGIDPGLMRDWILGYMYTDRISISRKEFDRRLVSVPEKEQPEIMGIAVEPFKFNDFPGDWFDDPDKSGDKQP